MRDIDAPGGLMGLLTDRAGIQFRMLNMSKRSRRMGSARAQCDLRDYSKIAREAMESLTGLSLIQGNSPRSRACRTGVWNSRF